jgi:diguanylate cyclase
MIPFVWALLRRWLVGDDQRQQIRAAQALLVLGVYIVFAGVQHAEVLLGMIDEAASWRLTAYNLCGGVLFYGLIRSGLNLRLPWDRALTGPQTVWAMVAISWSYAITGPARGAVVLIMMPLILLGMFVLSPRQSRRLTAVGFALLGGVMVWKGWTDPLRYDPRVEAMHFIFAGIVMATCAVLSIHIGRMRLRLQAQRADLGAALQRIQALATRDDLTGLLNRRAVIERLHLELRERERQPRLAVALIDLDHFKRINDSFGHAGGDTVLRRFAEIARTEVRDDDVVARWGGEEFLLMMSGADAEQALRSLARIRERLHATPIDEVERGLVITFSAGVAECDDDADLERAIERADAAMYRAKQTGRDRTLRAAAPDCATLAVSAA